MQQSVVIFTSPPSPSPNLGEGDRGEVVGKIKIMKKNRFFVRLLINAVAFLIVSKIYSGMAVAGFWEAVIAALIWGIVNALLRPLLMLLALPVNFLTFGLFTFVINGLILFLTAQLYSGLVLSGLVGGIIAAILLSAVNVVLGMLLGEKKD